jgi:hypothetical protein
MVHATKTDVPIRNVASSRRSFGREVRTDICKKYIPLCRRGESANLLRV